MTILYEAVEEKMTDVIEEYAARKTNYKKSRGG